MKKKFVSIYFLLALNCILMKISFADAKKSFVNQPQEEALKVDKTVFKYNNLEFVSSLGLRNLNDYFEHTNSILSVWTNVKGQLTKEAVDLNHLDQRFLISGVGNGGSLIHCRYENQDFYHLKDLYESKMKVLRYNHIETGEQLLWAFDKLSVGDPMLKENLIKSLAYLIDLTTHQFPRFTAQFVPDMFNRSVVSRECSEKYVAVFFNNATYRFIDSYYLHDQDVSFKSKTNFFYLDHKLYQKLDSNTDRAALWLHESLYFLSRMSGYKGDSSPVREIVASIFSSSKNEEVLERNLHTLGLMKSLQSTTGPRQRMSLSQ